jgi:hypothetical protein
MNHESLFKMPPEGKTPTGKRLLGPSGVELVVTKGGDDLVTDSLYPFKIKLNGEPEPVFDGTIPTRQTHELKLGQRFQTMDPLTGKPLVSDGVEVLVIKPGKADLMSGGFVMVEKPKPVIPSAD